MTLQDLKILAKSVSLGQAAGSVTAPNAIY